MKLIPLPEGGLRLSLDLDEAQLLDQLVGQLVALLQSHSGTALDPDPLFASLEVGGTESVPEDPALARLFPNAYDDYEEASAFRRVTEQGLVNRKLQDALDVTGSLGIGRTDLSSGGDAVVEVDIVKSTMPPWVRTLTALRLAIAARLGLEEEVDHARLLDGAETRSTVIVYDWLAAILDSILRVADS